MGFKLNDLVTVVGGNGIKHTIFQVVPQTISAAGELYWLDDTHSSPYYEEELRHWVDTEPQIETIYRVEKIDFSTHHEALRHLRKVKLWNALKSFWGDDSEMPEELLEELVKNRQKYLEILQ